LEEPEFEGRFASFSPRFIPFGTLRRLRAINVCSNWGHAFLRRCLKVPKDKSPVEATVLFLVAVGAETAVARPGTVVPGQVLNRGGGYCRKVRCQFLQDP
jgi:hypothetical protein